MFRLKSDIRGTNVVVNFWWCHQLLQMHTLLAPVPGTLRWYKVCCSSYLWTSHLLRRSRSPLADHKQDQREVAPGCMIHGERRRLDLRPRGVKKSGFADEACIGYVPVEEDDPGNPQSNNIHLTPGNEKCRSASVPKSEWKWRSRNKLKLWTTRYLVDT